MLSVLNDLLPSEWEFYVHPFLNGCRPDLIVLDPNVGIAVFEIKDWSLSSMNYERSDSGENAQFVVRHSSGGTFATRSPLEEVDLFRHEIRELYCPSLSRSVGIAAVTAGVIFTGESTASVSELFEPELREIRANERRYRPLAGRDALDNGALETLFPDAMRGTSSIMNESVASTFRAWLSGPHRSERQRSPVALNRRQTELATTRTASGYRRVRGPAGTGKSVVLAAKAARLSQTDERVLVVTFNHTLRSYLRDLVVRFGADPNRITWLGFHEWCKRTMQVAGHGARYETLADGGGHAAWLERLPLATLEALRSGPTRAQVARFDAILVDEGQDFDLDWWNLLRRVLRDGGEMLLIVDAAQDLYQRASRWTDRAMEGAGFRGPWSELSISYRMPGDLLVRVREFRSEFLSHLEEPLPEPAPQLQLAVCELAWTTVDKDQLLEELTERAIQLATADLCVLVDTQELGCRLVQALAERGVSTHHTFAREWREERERKRMFFQGDARVKVTTIHSFKGWEAPHLLIGFAGKDPRLAYTALTRLLADEGGVSINVVSAAARFAEYGRRWSEAPPTELSPSDRAR